MAKEILTIPATISPLMAQSGNPTAKRKVAAYARVSTDRDEQLTSYEAQVSYYTNYIKSREDWEFVGVYTDEGITGTSTKHREGFKSMVKDALDGKIELILAKSLSRFCRNTVDSLTTIRKLKAAGVECYFEKESIWTMDSKGELLVTILSSLAQEESRSISENVKWGKRKSFADGKVCVPFTQLLGYEKGEDGNLAVNEEQAETVRLIYKLFLSGLSFHAIAKELTKRQIPTPFGKEKWWGSTVKSILTSEKMKGDALLQKSYIADFLTKKQVKNRGVIPQYYVTGNHEPIITPETFELVQAEMSRRKAGRGKYSGVSIFSSRIKCGECGSWYGSKVWHSNDAYRRVIWQCNHKFEGTKCSSPHFTEEEIKAIFVKAFNQLFECRKEILENISLVQKMICSTDKLETEQQKLANELQVMIEMAHNAIHQNATMAQDQAEYQMKYDELMKRYEDTKIAYAKTVEEISARKNKDNTLSSFAKVLRKQENILDDFDEGLWGTLVESMTVHGKDNIEVLFKNGTVIQVK